MHTMSPKEQYIVRNKAPLSLKSVRLRFRPYDKVLGIPRGDHGPGPNGGEDYAPFCVADILAVEIDDASDEMLDDDLEPEIVIGHIRAQTVQVGRIMNEGMSLREICDMQSDELMDVHNSLYVSDLEPKDEFDECVGCHDLLYIHEVRLKQAYRGYGIGLLAVHGLIQGLPSFSQGTVLLSPNGIVDEAEEGADFEAASLKLQKYWKLIGFEMWANNDEHGQVMGLWTGYRYPDIQDVVPHLLGTYR